VDGRQGERGAGPLERLARVHPGEGATLALALAYGFLVFASWYVLRPLRDEMGIAGGADQLAWLFTGTLAATLLVQPAFAALSARFPRRRFVPWTYRFFAVQLVAFFAVLARGGADPVVAGRVFFVWTSVFNLFVVSVFWALVADVFREEQGRRLFGLIAAGVTLGGICGGALTALLVGRLGSAPLLLVSALLLEGAARAAAALGRRAGRDLPGQARLDGAPLGGDALAGIRRVLGSPYLIGIALFLLLYTVGSTFLYVLQARIVAEAITERAARAAFFARLDVAVNLLTLLLQTTVTGRVLARLGVGATLAVLPALSCAGFSVLALAPTLAVVATFQVVRRAANFALARPAREVLFVPLARADKYQAKTFLDTFVYRLGDQTGVWSERALRALGLGLTGTAGAAVPLAALWLGLAVVLGRHHARLAAKAPPD